MAKPVKKTHGTRPRHYVKEWRQYRGLTQDQLAERIEKTRGLISQIESGNTNLSEDTIYALADAFNCAPWDIMRVNPLKEGIVVDITDELRAHPDLQSETLGYLRGRVANKG